MNLQTIYDGIHAALNEIHDAPNQLSRVENIVATKLEEAALFLSTHPGVAEIQDFEYARVPVKDQGQTQDQSQTETQPASQPVTSESAPPPPAQV